MSTQVLVSNLVCNFYEKQEDTDSTGIYLTNSFFYFNENFKFLFIVFFTVEYLYNNNFGTNGFNSVYDFTLLGTYSSYAAFLLRIVESLTVFVCSSSSNDDDFVSAFFWQTCPNHNGSLPSGNSYLTV